MKTLSCFILCLLLLCNVFLVFSQENFDEYNDLFIDDNTAATEENSLEEFGEEWTLDSGVLTLDGEHSANMILPINPYYFNYNTPTRSPRVLNTIGLQYDTAHIKTVFNINADVWGGVQTESENNLGMGQGIFSLGESYIAFFNDYINISAGLKEYAWGSSLGFNPTDNINAFDYRQGIYAKRIPVLSAALTLYPLSFIVIEGIYVPLFQQNVYAFANSDTRVSVFQKNLQKQNNRFAISISGENPALDPYMYQAGVRTKFYLAFMDFAFSYIYDIDDNYSIDTITTTIPTLTSSGSIHYDLIQRRIHRFGLDMTGVAGAFTWWGEGAFNISEDYNLNLPKVRNHTAQWTMGGDLTIGKDDALHIGLQHIGKYVFDYNNTIDFTDTAGDIIEYQNNILGQETEALNLGMMLTLSLGLLDDKITPALQSGYFFPLLYDESSYLRYGSALISPVITFALVDSFALNIGAMLSFAWIAQENGAIILNQNVPRGKASDNNQVYIEFVYKWSKFL